MTAYALRVTYSDVHNSSKMLSTYFEKAGEQIVTQVLSKNLLQYQIQICIFHCTLVGPAGKRGKAAGCDKQIAACTNRGEEGGRIRCGRAKTPQDRAEKEKEKTQSACTHRGEGGIDTAGRPLRQTLARGEFHKTYKFVNLQNYNFAGSQFGPTTAIYLIDCLLLFPTLSLAPSGSIDEDS